MRKTTPREETAYVGSRKAHVHLQIRAHSSIKGKGRPRSLSPTGEPHDGGAKDTPQKLLVKVCQEKQTYYFVQASSQEVFRRQNPVIIGMLLDVQKFNLQPEASSETRVFTNTHLNLLMKNQRLLQFTLRRMMNA